MIEINKTNQTFHISTAHSSYIMSVLPSKHLGHVYYGKKLKSSDSIEPLIFNYHLEVGSQVLYDQSDRTFTLNLALLEASTYGKGDYRDPMMHFRLPDGSRLTDFHYDNYEILAQKPSYPELPESFGDNIETLKIRLIDDVSKLSIELLYSVFYEDDIITRRTIIQSLSNDSIVIEKAMSTQIDFPHHNFDLVSLDGAWIRERHIHHRKLTYGIVKIDSKRGVSSSDHNPFVALKEEKTDENHGECYGFSLIYSGNFEASAEVAPHDSLRFLMGINSFDFYWNLEPGQTFVTPESVMTYSSEGLNRLSQNFHHFVNKNIIPQQWQGKERPILINNWEATYFDFTERKLLTLARKAKKLGMELFVLDDGWFGKRNDDHSSLGDWYVNKKKLPSGLSGLSAKINRMGLDFGIWVEPEMISPDSDLYREHPDYAIAHPNRTPALGRNQLILDLTRSDVQEYIIDQMTALFKSANIVYCKWDMNRSFSDVYSHRLESKQQGEFFHRYLLGLYSVLSNLTQRFPQILFESCASGGNRYDLGMLCYMPQTWVSDDTDGIERLWIQYGTSYAYPLSTMGAHVSQSPNAQTLRTTPIETRFNTAAFGLLGYELDLSKLSRFDRQSIQRQISFYKDHRRMLQFGTFYRLEHPDDSNECRWMVVSETGDEALVGHYQLLSKPNPPRQIITVKGLLPEGVYHISNRPQYLNLKLFGDLIHHALPVKISAKSTLFHWLSNFYLMPTEVESFDIDGDALANNGFIPAQNFMGTGYHPKIRILGDFGSRIYHLKRKEVQ